MRTALIRYVHTVGLLSLFMMVLSQNAVFAENQTAPPGPLPG
jgi:hypothetical protein